MYADLQPSEAVKSVIRNSPTFYNTEIVMQDIYLERTFHLQSVLHHGTYLYFFESTYHICVDIILLWHNHIALAIQIQYFFFLQAIFMAKIATIFFT